MRCNVVIVAMLLVCLSKMVLGQVDSLYSLDEIDIYAIDVRTSSIGSHEQRWDRKALERFPAQNLSELLFTQTGTYIRNYGPGTLATSSIRGGSAGHTLVTWNGLPIQSPMLGQLDLSLLPLGIAEEISFQAGGNAANWGSGAITGHINLENKRPEHRGLEVHGQTEYGSFARFNQGINITWGTKVFQSKTRFLHHQSQNDFWYEPAPGIDKRQQSNASIRQQNFLQDLYWQVNNKHQLEAHIWLQNSARFIPPTNVQTRSEAFQDDRSRRLSLNWKYVSKRGMLQSKFAFFDEDLNYVDPLIGLTSLSRFRSLLGELTQQWQIFPQYTLSLGATHILTKAWSDGYANIPVENRTGIFSVWRWKGTKSRMRGSLRQTFVDGKQVPLVPNLSVDYELGSFINLKAKISKDYRLPTLNDRFWRPGGNPDLLPESGWSEELGISFSERKNDPAISMSLTAFNRLIENWILWSIREGESYWSANNISRVWSRGVEVRLVGNREIGELGLRMTIGYDWTRSTNQVNQEDPKIQKGEQLLYTPIHQLFGTIGLKWRTWAFTYQQNYVGKTRGVNDDVPAYTIGNVRLQYEPSSIKFLSSAYIHIQNTWDRQYVVIERRPMPGIHFQAGLIFHFPQKNPKNTQKKVVSIVPRSRP